MDVDTHRGEGIDGLFARVFQGLHEFLADREKGILWPFGIPIDGAAVDEGGEEAASVEHIERTRIILKNGSEYSVTVVDF